MKIKKSIMTGVALLLLLTANMVIMAKGAATNGGHPPALIAELGEASTVLIYSEVDATVKVYVPDENWNPTTQYLLVPIAIGTWASLSTPMVTL